MNKPPDAQTDSRCTAYELVFNTADATIGFFSCEPVEKPDLGSALAHLKTRPNDEFMHKHALTLIGELPPDEVKRLIAQGRQNDKQLLALMYEVCLVNHGLRPLQDLFDDADPKSMAEHSPLNYIDVLTRADHDLHQRWINLFTGNLTRHRPLPRLKDAGLTLPFDPDAEIARRENMVHVKDVAVSSEQAAYAPVPYEATIKKALERLSLAGLSADQEMRHQGCLAPIALLRQWYVNILINCGANRCQVSGPQISYGRGFSLNQARAGYLMEIVERFSAYANFMPDCAVGYKQGHWLIKASYGELIEDGQNALDPNSLGLEAPYRDQRLYWIKGETPGPKGRRPAWVPGQFVFLFCNLDEPSLVSGLASTGLASGNTRSQAELAAMLEVIERDAEATTLYTGKRCFIPESDDPQISELLRDLGKHGIHVMLMDMTPGTGVPCYKAFVRGKDGSLAKGCGAGLSGMRAAISAITEVPYPYPGGPRSAPAPKNLKKIKLEDLPDYSTGDPTLDADRLERLLAANGRTPIFVDLTRTDLDIPVVRAVIPGMEMIADFDEFSRVSPGLLADYVKNFG